MSDYQFEHGKPYVDPKDKKIQVLLEAAEKAEKIIEENFLQSVVARDTLKILKEAIAQAERT